MQESSHHGRIIREYREAKAGITQEELAQKVGKSRRTIITLEQSAYITDTKLRRTLAWVLQIPPQLLGLTETSMPETVVLNPLEPLPTANSKKLNHIVLDTLVENIRMRLDLYYLGGALGADRNLNSHIDHLTQLAQKSGSSKDRYSLITLLSHNYQLKGMIARDQLDYAVAENCFEQSSLLAQEAGSTELHALAIARLALVTLWQDRAKEATALYETAREISKRSSPVLRTYLASAHAEAQGTIGEPNSLRSLDDARSLLKRVDPKDDYLLLFHSTRPSEQSINDGWLNCHTLLGRPLLAIENYDTLEKKLDLSMTRMRARLYIQYAEALYVNKDLSSCFYAIEGLKLARSVGSRRLFQRARELAVKLASRFPNDLRDSRIINYPGWQAEDTRYPQTISPRKAIVGGGFPPPPWPLWSISRRSDRSSSPM